MPQSRVRRLILRMSNLPSPSGQQISNRRSKVEQDLHAAYSSKFSRHLCLLSIGTFLCQRHHPRRFFNLIATILITAEFRRRSGQNYNAWILVLFTRSYYFQSQQRITSQAENRKARAAEICSQNSPIFGRVRPRIRDRLCGSNSYLEDGPNRQVKTHPRQ